MRVAGVILAGGESRRMGRNKALLSLAGEPILSRVIRAVHQVTSELLLVTNTPDAYTEFELPMVPDRVPGFGALGGIHTGLKSVAPLPALIVACDMPFLSTSVLRLMIRHSESHDLVVPASEQGYEPLCAVYGQACVPPIQSQIEEGRRRVDRFFPEVRLKLLQPAEWRPLDPEGHTFLNVNTEQDYRHAQAIVRGD